MKMAATVNERVTKGITSQGFYVAAPDGKGYGFNNNRSVERVNWFMDNAVKKMKDNPPQIVEIPQSEIDAPFARSPGEGTSVLRIFSRIRPVPAGSHKSNNTVARDHIWIYPHESTEMWKLTEVSAAEPRRLPSAVLGRLLRFHLVDNVRGEPDFWKPSEIRKADFKASLFGRSNSNMRGLRFEGTYEMQSADGKRGMSGNLEGVIWLTKRSSEPKVYVVDSFKAYGEATAWGAGTYTPNPPAGKFPMVFAIVQVNDAASKVVTPQAATWAGEYENPGLKP
jgi:hypothetical protein